MAKYAISPFVKPAYIVGRPGLRSFTAIPISLNTSPGPVTITPSPTRIAWMRPSRNVAAVPSRSACSVVRAQARCHQRDARRATRAGAGRDRLGELPLPLLAHGPDLLQARQRLEREADAAHRRGELDRPVVDRLAAVRRDLHDRPLGPVDHPPRAREAARERVQRLDPEVPAHQLGLVLRHP